MVGNHRTIYNESLIYLSLELNPFFAKKVNQFSIKSEPILQNEPIRILYPFIQLPTGKNSGLNTILSSFNYIRSLQSRMI